MQPTPSEFREIAARFSAWGDSAAALDDGALLAFAAAFDQVARVVGAVQTRVAGEIGARSRSELGEDGLSRSQNFSTPAKLLAAVTRTSTREAKARLDLGERMRGAELLGGGVAPDPFPLVREAMSRGEVGVECAAVITAECAALVKRGTDPVLVSEAEEHLVAAARNPLLTVDDVPRLAVRIRESLDPDGLEPRAEAQREARSFTLNRSTDGMYRGRLALPPEDGALWLGALQAMISPRTTPRFRSEDEFVTETITADPRTLPQKMADAATGLIARAAGAPEMPHLAGATTTVNVHVSVADLESGRGPGWIDGIDEPVPMSTVERLRCHSPQVVTVFGHHGEVLHHGKARRLFSPAQNRALAARDGGCVWPGCDRPPSGCETHHVEEWRSPAHPPGRTDVENGVLLCRFHHARIHKPAWRLTMRHGVPHIVPPRWRDPSQTPIPVTRRRTFAPESRFTSAPGSRPDTERRTV
ncbi:HNH endonuclease signature motif containing protein [Herbiconiux ginsengi]|uniref:HNH nuclease domain-containing protein n=1 Tax=Herbiconiux ginsengi TaxID=381665 RepID=A0A1H3S1S3_9MICO|nr:HNH endonuclease signature motif containing protein [Herbiconiux ginsengi]SDZ31882.1 protein of unknown function [Herbiconiux ginsengi]